MVVLFNSFATLRLSVGFKIEVVCRILCWLYGFISQSSVVWKNI